MKSWSITQQNKETKALNRDFNEELTKFIFKLQSNLNEKDSFLALDLRSFLQFEELLKLGFNYVKY